MIALGFSQLNLPPSTGFHKIKYISFGVVFDPKRAQNQTLLQSWSRPLLKTYSFLYAIDKMFIYFFIFILIFYIYLCYKNIYLWVFINLNIYRTLISNVKSDTSLWGLTEIEGGTLSSHLSWRSLLQCHNVCYFCSYVGVSVSGSGFIQIRTNEY